MDNKNINDLVFILVKYCKKKKIKSKSRKTGLAC